MMELKDVLTELFPRRLRLPQGVSIRAVFVQAGIPKWKTAHAGSFS
jgi:hypothetical protein